MRLMVHKLSDTIKKIGIVSGEDHITAPLRVPRRFSSCFDDANEEDNVHTNVDGTSGHRPRRHRHRRIATMTMTTMPTTVTSLTIWENSSVHHPWPRLLSTLITLLAPSTPMLTSITLLSSLNTLPQAHIMIGTDKSM